MNYKKGFNRIYIVLSVLWCLFWSFIAFTDQDIVSAVIGVLFPVIMYLVITWVVNDFKD